MAKQLITIGTPGAGGGDPAHAAFKKINDNATELYNQLGVDPAGNLPDALPITKGGTGAANAAGARTNLEITALNASNMQRIAVGGSIILSGTAVINTDASGYATISVGIAFPNSITNAVVSIGNPTDTDINIQVDDTNHYSATTFIVRTVPNKTLRVNYVATGN